MNKFKFDIQKNNLSWEETHYKNGKKDGVLIMYYWDGNIDKEHYKNGERYYP